MAAIDDLIISRNNVIAKYKEASTNPKPSYSVDGQSVSWESYLSNLSSEIDKLNKLIVMGMPDEEDIVEIETQMY